MTLRALWLSSVRQQHRLALSTKPAQVWSSSAPYLPVQVITLAGVLGLAACTVDSSQEGEDDDSTESTDFDPSSGEDHSSQDEDETSDDGDDSTNSGDDPSDEGSEQESEDSDENSGTTTTDDDETTDPGDSDSSETSGEEESSEEIDWSVELEHAFPADRVIDLKLKFESGGLQTLLDAWNNEKDKVVQPAALEINDLNFPKVGARFKGFSSLLALPGKTFGDPAEADDKLPFRIDFDEYGGDLYYHLEKLSVDNTIWDPSFMRQRMTARMYQLMGVPASETAYAALTVDDKLAGLTVLTQVVDKKFLRRHFGTESDADDGNLYKCVNQANATDPVCLLNWHGDQKSNYVFTTDCEEGRGECGLVLKTNEDDPTLSDYSDLIHFLKVLNQSSPTEFPAAIAEVFDVDLFLRTMAVTAVLSNLDSYFGRINNFYLYHQPDTGKFIYLPWDFNLSYGGYPCRNATQGDLISFSIDRPVCLINGTSRIFPLIDKLLEVKEFDDKYRAYVRECVEKYFTRETHEMWIAEFEALIADPLSVDPNRAYTLEEHATAISDAMSTKMGDYGGYNILDFVERRRAFILEELAAPVSRLVL